MLNGGLEDEEVADMPVPTLLARLDSVRRVRARQRLEAFSDGLVAARGDEDSVTKTRESLITAAGLACGRAARKGIGALSRMFKPRPGK